MANGRKKGYRSLGDVITPNDPDAKPRSVAPIPLEYSFANLDKIREREKRELEEQFNLLREAKAGPFAEAVARRKPTQTELEGRKKVQDISDKSSAHKKWREGILWGKNPPASPKPLMDYIEEQRSTVEMRDELFRQYKDDPPDTLVGWGRALERIAHPFKDSTQATNQDPKKKGLSPAQQRIRSYEITRHLESGSFAHTEEGRHGQVGDGGSAIGDLQIWEPYFDDAQENAENRNRPFHLERYEDLSIAEHAGAETYAEYQRRWNEADWKKGPDPLRAALMHRLGATEFTRWEDGKIEELHPRTLSLIMDTTTKVNALVKLPAWSTDHPRWQIASQQTPPTAEVTFSPSDEEEFQKFWKVTQHALDLPPLEEMHYDMRAWYANAEPEQKWAMAMALGTSPKHPPDEALLRDWHFQSTFKTQGHPNEFMFDKKGTYFETATDKPVLDWFAWQTLSAINPEEAAKYSWRLRDSDNIWAWQGETDPTYEVGKGHD